MVRFLPLLLFLAPGFESRAQYIVAGQHGIKYTDIIPDTTINSSRTYSIDINQDGSYDIRFTSFQFFAAGGNETSCHADALNSSTQLFQDYTDSCYITFYSSWSIINMARKFVAGDTVKNGSALSSTDYFSSNSTNAGTNCIRNGWLSAGDKYLGVRYADVSGTYYGWVLLSVTTYSTMVIKEYSLNQPVSAGVQEQSAEASSLVIFPQPAHGDLQLKMNCKKPDQTVLEIMNSMGQVVARKNFSTQIIVSDLSPGCYILGIFEPDKPVRYKRFVKE